MIKFDFSNCLSENIKQTHGISKDRLLNFCAKNKDIVENVERAQYGFMKLPFLDIKGITEYIDTIKQEFDNFVVLGIGGSALGNIALHSALNHSFHNLKNKNQKVFVLDNVSPEKINDLQDIIDLKKTIFNVITKSGTTAETMSQFLFFYNLVKKNNLDVRKHFVFTTDKEKGVLKKISDETGIKRFIIPSDVGGRFSVLSPVGLLSASFSGINIEKLIYGARKYYEYIRNSEPTENFSLINSAVHYLLDTEKGKKISVLMPYSNQLYYLADWYRQLWAESLGKRLNRNKEEIYCGQTPVKALGTTDQHSQVQLYIEGPNDKIISFIIVENFEKDIKIPEEFKEEEALRYLNNKNMSSLLNYEALSTSMALTENSRPNLTITLDKIDAENLGALIFYYELSTAYSGEMYNIDAFNQPGVESGKKLTYAFMGRPGFENLKQEIEKYSIKAEKFILNLT